MENMITFEKVLHNLESKVELSKIGFDSIVQLYEDGDMEAPSASSRIREREGELRAIIRFCHFYLHAITEEECDQLISRVDELGHEAWEAIFYTTK